MRGGELPAGHQQGKGDGEIKGGAFLAQIGRSQVDHHAHKRAAEAAVAQGGSDPLPGFLNGLVRQTHQLDARQARGEIHLHHHWSGLQTLQGCTETTCQHSVEGDACLLYTSDAADE